MDRYSVCINEMNQGEAISVFTLMILEIAIQKMKISSISKTTDMSDRSELASDYIQLRFIHHAFLTINTYYTLIFTLTFTFCCASLENIGHKNCTQILKGLNKYNYIIVLAYRVYVLRCIILLSMKIKEIFKICTFRDCPFDRIFCVAGRLQ